MYSEYRNHFLTAAAKTSLLHRAVLHDNLGSQNEPLWTDYLYTPEKKPYCLIHLSGTHGIEGYLGSLIQREILLQLQDSVLSDHQLVFVHAVNPFGMSWFQRTNAANVDLNRNFLQGKKINNPHFQQFLPFLNSGTGPQRQWSFVKTLPLMVRLGLKQTVQTVACGQNEYSDSLFYAGTELQPELVSLQENLREIVSLDSQIYVIDIHTGLGGYGEESLIVDETAHAGEINFFKNTLQTKILHSSTDSRVYSTEGGLARLFKYSWDSQKALFFHQEFGTRSFLPVLWALMDANQVQKYIRTKTPATSIPGFSETAKTMTDSFFPEALDWRATCLRLGLLRFQQLNEKIRHMLTYKMATKVP
ncbi:MAG: hypothetical protein COT73_01445 [Bdellovibrio sp. CG10_big_fil_rev_8_21_14_0_10_47_8]|nr:MAG: hypothetical protein COT73_01445 [Bdellovibrio sp. CG10_big_fil_rev_8_21_14_0_10_47_8]